jgi:general L-amino acid transport system substrate-binding protein
MSQMKSIGRFLPRVAAVALLSVALLASPGRVSAQDALDAIKQRGTLRASAHNGSFRGFFELDAQGKWKGFDIQFAKALAAAIFGSSEKVTYVPVSWAQRFPALQSGDIDVLLKATGWTFSRDVQQNLDFSIPYFIGGFQFMVPTVSKIKSPKDMKGATVCTASGTSIEPILAGYMASNSVSFKVVTYEKSEELQEAYFSGRCDVYAAWGPSLAVTRRLRVTDPSTQTILPLSITLEPISAGVRRGNPKLHLVVNWVIAAMIRAEELGITSTNVDDMRDSVKKNPAQDPSAAKLLGVTGNYGEMLGLPADWAYNVIKQVGNYGEVYNRELGEKSEYKLDRGFNRLWSDGGLIYAPVFD